MGIMTPIQWCDSTINPVSGCDGCELWNPKSGVSLCYAGRMTHRFNGRNSGLSPKFEEIMTRPGRMAAAARWSDLTGTRRPDKPCSTACRG